MYSTPGEVTMTGSLDVRCESGNYTLAICSANNLTIIVTITCGIQPYQYCYYGNESVSYIT